MKPSPSLHYRLSLAETKAEIDSIQGYIRTLFQHEFQANVPHFLPFLVGLYDQHQQLCGACGLNPAGLQSLYLEHYLDAPVEQVLGVEHGLTTPRSGVVEIGNFACEESGMARILFAALCEKLYQQGFDYVVLTGTSKIRNVFSRMKLETLILSEAESGRVGSDAADWGDYYEHHPMVLAAELSHGYQILRQNSLLLQLLESTPLPPLQPQRSVPDMSALQVRTVA